MSDGNGRLPSPAVLTGVLLGVDFGLRRVGLSICDPEGRVAVAGGRIEGLGGKALALAITAAARVRLASGIVIGEPAHSRGNEEVVEGILNLGLALQEEGFAVAMWPEGYTTASAIAARKHFGGKSKAGKGWMDESAAIILLQDYLDWKRNRA